MITLITGLPGNGKTLYALDWVAQKAKKENRPVFYARIKGVQEKGVLPWTLIDPYEWYKCPANAIIVIDEAQKSADPEDPKSPPLFGLRQRGAPVPIWASKLEDHRHGGVDLVLITQDPMLLDSHDRKLCQQHFHVVRTFGLQRATIHEWMNGVHGAAATSRTGSIRHEYAYNKAVYGWYTSAEVHTHKARIPAKVYVLVALIVALPVLAYYLYTRLDPTRNKPQPEGMPGPTPGVVTAVPAEGGARVAKLTRDEYAAQFAPRVAGLSYTAPVYDEVTKPVVAPYPAACVQMGARCQCYTQQATRLEVPSELCAAIAQGGFFVSWQQPVAHAVPMHDRQQWNAVQRVEQGGITSLGGSPVSHVRTEEVADAAASQTPPPGRGRNLPPVSPRN